MKARPTMPVPKWEIPDPAAAAWDQQPPESQIREVQNPVDMRLVHKKANTHIPATSVLSGRVFQGRLNVSDLDYMAMAILQMCDENFELRERVRQLEERLGVK